MEAKAFLIAREMYRAFTQKVHSLAKPESSLLRREGMIVLSFFAIGALLRTIPELETGIYPAGYDTMTGYITSIMTPVSLSFGSLAQAPLLQVSLSFIHDMFAISPLLELKVTVPLLFGLLSASFYYMISRYAIGWAPKTRCIAALLFSFEPAVLRLGWDLLRLELALSFLFLLIGATHGRLVGQQNRSWIQQFTLVLLSILIVLSDQLISVLLLVILGWQALKGSIHRDRKSFLTQAAQSFLDFAPAIAVFILTISSNSKAIFGSSNLPLTLSGGTGPKVMFATPGIQTGSIGPILVNYFLSDPRFVSGSYFQIMEYVGSLSLFTVIPLVAFAIYGFKFDNVFSPLLIFLVAAGYSILVSPSLALSYYWRWILLLPVPLTYFAVNGLSRLSIRLPMLSNPTHRKTLTAGMIILLASVGLAYSGASIPLISGYTTSYMPAGLSTTSFPLTEIPSISLLSNWANLRLAPHSYVLASLDYEGYLKLSLRSDLVLVVLPPGQNIEQAAVLASSIQMRDHTGQIFLLWAGSGGRDFAPIITTSSLVLLEYKCVN